MSSDSTLAAQTGKATLTADDPAGWYRCVSKCYPKSGPQVVHYDGRGIDSYVNGAHRTQVETYTDFVPLVPARDLKEAERELLAWLDKVTSSVVMPIARCAISAKAAEFFAGVQAEPQACPECAKLTQFFINEQPRTVGADTPSERAVRLIGLLRRYKVALEEIASAPDECHECYADAKARKALNPKKPFELPPPGTAFKVTTYGMDGNASRGVTCDYYRFPEGTCVSQAGLSWTENMFRDARAEIVE